VGAAPESVAITRKQEREAASTDLSLVVRSEHPHHLGGDDLGIGRQELAEVRAGLARERVALANVAAN
jgi:hypothetical protein